VKFIRVVYIYIFWYKINCCRMIILPFLLFSCQGTVRVTSSYVIHRHHCRLLLLCTCSDTLFSFLRAHTSTNDLFGSVLPPRKAIVAQGNKNLPFLMEAEGSLPCILWPKELDSLGTWFTEWLFQTGEVFVETHRRILHCSL
jgi:hypothetical protein